MRFNYLLGLLLIVFTMQSCQKSEKDNLIAVYDELYSHILNLDFDKVEGFLNQESKVFYSEITDHDNLNIDSMLVLGKKYRIPFMLTDYLAIAGDKIKKGSSASDFYKYLGSEKVSFFSYEDAYYTDKAKSKLGKENFVSIIRDDLTSSKRGWARFTNDATGEYKYDLLYTLRNKENANSKKNAAERKRNPEKKTLEEFLSYYYWQNSGDATDKFRKQQDKLEASMLEARKDMMEVINARKK